jgi:hypothetical protein
MALKSEEAWGPPPSSEYDDRKIASRILTGYLKDLGAGEEPGNDAKVFACCKGILQPFEGRCRDVKILTDYLKNLCNRGRTVKRCEGFCMMSTYFAAIRRVAPEM